LLFVVVVAADPVATIIIIVVIINKVGAVALADWEDILHAPSDRFHGRRCSRCSHACSLSLTTSIILLDYLFTLTRSMPSPRGQSKIDTSANG
jgi:hypothetical protein